ncbi:hypothetical protein CAOG_02624 [Capsaspora owczarzaki ATCC 30864]|uniref:Uncharacterized protein n=1 Tax=Capsaspora owczarzaki (strain ATCC 30864) TaxID=595528 RepID=A0A0D2WLL9_CAPO3|nr:hypothetical protein CAOG_02624 [Capsaspora owczarzaki ATCC 30864]KJE91495.1 hypothetical protein CAOG_002624 [Capsaspora owczarzaki ATCC 30864]|eukprot:XP_004349374.1 hypothetical protein CAOG_02624 [Capsaspora owczarzaki ATCC 30864]
MFPTAGDQNDDTQTIDLEELRIRLVDQNAPSAELNEVMELLQLAFTADSTAGQRASISDDALGLIVQLFFQLFDEENERLFRVVGRTIAFWLYNNETAKRRLREQTFTMSPAKSPLTFLAHLNDRFQTPQDSQNSKHLSTIALILQNWVYREPVAQLQVFDSAVFDAVVRHLHHVSLSRLSDIKKEMLFVQRACQVFVEINIGECLSQAVEDAKRFVNLLAEVFEICFAVPLAHEPCLEALDAIIQLHPTNMFELPESTVSHIIMLLGGVPDDQALLQGLLDRAHPHRIIVLPTRIVSAVANFDLCEL